MLANPHRHPRAGTVLALASALLLITACAPGATVDATVTFEFDVVPVYSGVIYVVQVPSHRPRNGITVRAHDGRVFKIPPGHYPPPGTCRVWRPELPPGRQDRPGSCSQLERRVPATAFLVRG